MHLTASEIEVDTVVGNDTREALGDSSKLKDDGLVGHVRAIL